MRISMKQAEQGTERPMKGGLSLTAQRPEHRKVRTIHRMQSEIARLSARVDELECERAEQEREYRELEGFVAMAAHDTRAPAPPAHTPARRPVPTGARSRTASGGWCVPCGAPGAEQSN